MIFVCMYVRVYMCMCMPMYVYVYVCVGMYVQVYVCMYVCVCVYDMYVYVCLCMCMIGDVCLCLHVHAVTYVASLTGHSSVFGNVHRTCEGWDITGCSITSSGYGLGCIQQPCELPSQCEQDEKLLGGSDEDPWKENGVRTSTSVQL